MCKFGKIELDEQCKVVPLLFFPLTYLKIDEMRLSMSNSERGMEKEVWKNEDRIVSKKSQFFFLLLRPWRNPNLPTVSFSFLLLVLRTLFVFRFVSQLNALFVLLLSVDRTA